MEMPTGYQYVRAVMEREGAWDLKRGFGSTMIKLLDSMEEMAKSLEHATYRSQYQEEVLKRFKELE